MSDNIIINKIQLTQNKRQQSDIKTWRQALLQAENILSERRAALMDLYQDVLLDAHLSGVIRKRKNTILNTNLAVGAGGVINEDITQLINQPEGLALLNDLLDTLFFGHTLIEFSFDGEAGFTYSLVPRRYIAIKKGLVLLDVSDAEKGIDFRAPAYEKSILELGCEDRLGLLAKAAPMALYKRNCLSDFAQYAEIFGRPIRKITYDPNDPAAHEQAIQDAQNPVGGLETVIMNSNSNIEFIESSQKSGSVEVFTQLIDAANAEMSKLILGNTLTTQQGATGTQALGTVHQGSEEQIILNDRQFLLNALNYPFKKLLIDNGFKIKEEEVFFFKESEELDLTRRIVIDSQLNNLIPIEQAYFYETYNIPVPEKGAAIAALKEPREDVEDADKGSEKKAADKKKSPKQEDKDSPKDKTKNSLWRFFTDAS